jgi:tryptophan synthase beta subunit
MAADENPLERAFMARVRADEYAQELNRLQKEFDGRPDVLDLKRRIERCEEERRQCIAQAKAAGISKQGNYLLKIRTRKTRNVIPKLFFAKHGAEAFIECCTVAIGKAEALLGKAALDDCCEVEVKETGVSVEYVRPEAGE